MSRKLRKKLIWAVNRAEMLLVRNSCPHETFHGVLNQVDVRALRALANFAHKSVVASETRYIASARYPLRPLLL